MSRISQIFHKEWLFHLGDVEQGQSPEYDDEMWRTLDLPHDWSIEGPFKQFRDENWGMFQNLDHRIGYLPQGIGWYRKHFFAPVEWQDKIVCIQFDGIYRNSDVWINGHHLGHRPYGYASFEYDLTPYLKINASNTIAVRVDSLGISSRWYPGSGIYRKVTLSIMEKIHIRHWGTYWTTPEVSKDRALINLKIWIMNESSENNINLEVFTEIFEKGQEKKGNPVAIQKGTYKLDKKEYEIVHNLEVLKPKLWDPDSPNLYIIKNIIKKNETDIDEYYTPLGLRSFKFDPNEGFSINGKSMKFKGVCLHNDNGCIGAAIHIRAVERKLRIMKEMGCNAIRTSHNPPEQELLDLCDEMGFMVMDEAFDEWVEPKTPMGYTRFFNEWCERDVRDYVHRDRNHPCVIIWSCGNEVSEQRTQNGVKILKRLLDVFHKEDPTRPVTQGCNQIDYANKTGFADLLDIVGYNYMGDKITKVLPNGFECKYDVDHKTYPNRIMIGSENCSSWNTRGVYTFPIGYSNGSKIHDNFHCSSYDVISEIPLIIMKTRPYVCGMFTWEGFDYIGEPTPYPWPARSSQYGLVDLAGFPKDCYYLYQTQWLDKPVVHLFPHWNWHKGMEIPVWVYTNCEKVELILNGKSLGEKSLLDEDYNDVLHLEWIIPYEPGELKAIARNKGKVVAEKSVITASEPHHIVLTPERLEIDKDGDLAYIKVSVHDIYGNICPTANNLITFKVQGPGKVIGTDNGNPISLEPFDAQQRHVFGGLALAVLKSLGAGEITVIAASAGLETAKITLYSK